MDRRLVRVEVAGRVGRGQRRFAQHVERVCVALRLALARVREGLVDRAPGDELPAQEPHREIDALAYQRLAALAQERRERLLERALVARVDEPAGDEQAPRGRIDEQRRRRADVRAPIAAADLVADQAIARGCVRNAQERLGDAHQRDALAAVERELEHQGIDPAGLRALRAHRFGEPRRMRLRRREGSGCKPRFGHERAHSGSLVGAIGRGYALAQRGERRILGSAGRESEIEAGRAIGKVGHGRLPEDAGRGSRRRGARF